MSSNNNNNSHLLVKAKNGPRKEAGTSLKKEVSIEETVANKMINILLKAGYTYDEMIPIFRLAKLKYKVLLTRKKMKNIKVYLAGKVTGEDYQQCFDKFRALDETLSNLGFQTLNPMRIVPRGTGWEDAMEILKPHLLNSNVALFLPDWTDSKGSIQERIISKKHNIRIIDYEQLNQFIKAFSDDTEH